MKVLREMVASAYLSQTGIPVANLRVPDHDYTLPTCVMVRDHMENFEVKPYVAESADCDNRALLLLAHFSGLGYAFGWASVGPHDICTFLSDEKKVWYVEPSTCAIYPPDEPLTWLVMP